MRAGAAAEEDDGDACGRDGCAAGVAGAADWQAAPTEMSSRTTAGLASGRVLNMCQLKRIRNSQGGGYLRGTGDGDFTSVEHKLPTKLAEPVKRDAHPDACSPRRLHVDH